jgi:PAS domain S-box-containing protein
MVTSEPIKFLLVDDMSENLLALEAIIRRKGLEVLVARSGSDALELLLVHDVSLALLDVQMPGMDGFELAELMRGVERTKHVPIIFVTAGTRDPQRVFKGYESGAVDFLFKPIDPHILKSKVNVIFDLAHQRREASQIHEKILAMNEALMLGSLRQRELIEVGDSLNIQLQSEIRARKLAEEALAKTAAELAAIQTAISEAAIIAITDVTGKIEQVNDNFVHISKYSREELIGQDHRLLNAGLRAKEFIRDLSVTIANGNVWRNEIRNRAKDGSLYWVDTTIAPIVIERGKPVKYIAVGFDITARKLVEEEQKKLDQRLRDQQFYTRSLIESNIDAIMTTDPSGIITDVNKQMEALTGCTRDELIGAPFKGYFTDPQRAEAGIIRALSERKVTDYELTACARDGKQTVVSYNATTFYDRDRILQGVFAAARDITEHKRVETELHQAITAKSRFLAAASHDLGQPLQALTLLQGLLARTAEGERAQKLTAQLGQTLVSMTGMLNSILDINQIETGIVRAEMVGFPINDLLERLRDEFTYQAQAQGLTFRVVLCGLSIYSDPRLLEQMIRNLLSNALKYTKRGGVLLGCRRQEGMLRIEIWDTGIGIPEKDLQAIFEEYHQLDNAARERSHGLGLGLSIVQRQADLLGHRVRVRSRLGRGSIFAIEVMLPPSATGPQLECAGR